MESSLTSEDNFVVPVPYNLVYFPTYFQNLIYPISQIPINSFVSVEEKKRKYQRTWDKHHIELLYSLTREFSLNTQKAIETLKETDLFSIANQLNRSPCQCLNKLREILATGTLKPGTWSEHEDKYIIEGIQANKKWGLIAKEINNRQHKCLKVRTGKQCKERWNNHLDPNVNKGPWSSEEDLRLLELYREFGNKWSKISQSINTRTENSIKNRLKSLINMKKQELSSIECSTVTIEGLISEMKNDKVSLNNTHKVSDEFQN